MRRCGHPAAAGLLPAACCLRGFGFKLPVTSSAKKVVTVIRAHKCARSEPEAVTPWEGKPLPMAHRPRMPSATSGGFSWAGRGRICGLRARIGSAPLGPLRPPLLSSCTPTIDDSALSKVRRAGLGCLELEKLDAVFWDAHQCSGSARHPPIFVLVLLARICLPTRASLALGLVRVLFLSRIFSLAAR
ncbi:hypothetical protein MPTK1_6g12160 [Marchantia polymorpha subsp. ruderalis]|uniref:Uncharacterized protein n=2 Tax=Marchantia polymorpha TaxID=3197 RepID=A0AAF6BR55_MARPO|nr:hypothetical protein MARPO_0135s0020 [Marchantia polymorpha]PTQ29736.1 hypothetical protein MARPO_0135s0020 [Marchantia polymorpha]BBN14488.1 hypothetical protein Mp_6g12160 [Marchantia polymorpha subsp. ruderalis]BBN14489.1 hypothetical protein Mp_6g12160 [Marchantia polymorpha subsp. ruderalis]|eukprot:PTQ29735.1 hypothetical protein MARPO_0135s0020 [Marchantia polymorpha]